MSNIVPFEQQQALAASFVRSGLFGLKSPDQALALMAVCEAEGLHPASAVQLYHIVQGRPAMRADAMLARFQSTGGKVQWNDYTDAKVSATFSHPQGGSVKVEWTFEQAKKIGLTSKDNWRNYPRAMLRARVISEGVRTVFPGATTGVYTVEEVQDFTSVPQSAPIDMGAADVVPPIDLLSLETVLERIDAAQTQEELADTRELLKRLSPEDRKTAIRVGKERKHALEMTERAENVDAETGELLPADE